jgi:hypothetical protein
LFQKSKTVIQSYKYLFMHMRNDMCVDSVVLRMFEKHTIDVEEESKPSAFFLSSSSSNMEVTEDRSRIGSSSSAGSLSPQKESLLVQINNRVKLLEKNATVSGSLLRQLNASILHQAADMDHILEAVIRAKETFKDSLQEQLTVRSRLQLLTQRVEQFEMIVEESSQTVKLLTAAVVGLAVGCLYLLCSLLGGSASSLGATPTKEVATMTDDGAATASCNSTKKVLFLPTPPVVGTHCGSSWGPIGRRRGPPSRRVTWCGGSANSGDNAWQRQQEELQLEEEILKSILKKTTAAPVLDTCAIGGQLSSRRRVTWCGGYLRPPSDQLRCQAREI